MLREIRIPFDPDIYIGVDAEDQQAIEKAIKEHKTLTMCNQYGYVYADGRYIGLCMKRGKDMQIVAGDVKRVITGMIVYLVKAPNILGKVLEVEGDSVTLELCENDLVIKVSLEEIEETSRYQPNRKDKTEVHILGCPYTIRIVDKDDYRATTEADGWLDHTKKEILVYNFKQDVESIGDLVAYQKCVIRHEIIHGFLYESGLWQNSVGCKCWAKNEEMVDWLAIQSPKLYRAFKEAGVDE